MSINLRYASLNTNLLVRERFEHHNGTQAREKSFSIQAVEGYAHNVVEEFGSVNEVIVVLKFDEINTEKQ